jgi:hypothetical protein
MIQMVGNKTANQAAKPLKKGKKNHQSWNCRIALLVFQMLVL